MSKSYELSEFQVANLTCACDGENSRAFAIYKPNDDVDTPARYARFDRNLDEIEDLIHLGFLTDVSDRFTEQIELCKINNNRGYIAVAVTEQALMMFGPEKKGRA